VALRPSKLELVATDPHGFGGHGAAAVMLNKVKVAIRNEIVAIPARVRLERSTSGVRAPYRGDVPRID